MNYVEIPIWVINKQKDTHLKYVSKIWETKNGKYRIYYDYIKGYKHLRILRMDDKPIHNYMDLQKIKNNLLGKDIIAVEIYPKECNFRDGNAYHLWSWDFKKLDPPDLMKLYNYNDK